MIRDEDRVPRNVIDECARRGDDMIDALRRELDRGGGWDADAGTAGDWWLMLHAVMILGLIPGERAGTLLVEFRRRIAAEGDRDLDDWLDGAWPAFLANKPASTTEALRSIVADRGLHWYGRASTLDAVVVRSHATGQSDAALEWVFALAADESDELMFRVLAAQHLLDFPREPYRALLLDLAERETEFERVFDAVDVEKAYAAGAEPSSGTFQDDDPWDFYAPENIIERQEDWAREAALHEPYVREGPKIGRNDPCPCGSGKKYKRCCMPQA
jgi:hypothetical protein